MLANEHQWPVRCTDRQSVSHRGDDVIVEPTRPGPPGWAVREGGRAVEPSMYVREAGKGGNQQDTHTPSELWGAIIIIIISILVVEEAV